MPDFDRQSNGQAVISWTRNLYWSVRRELWEYRSIYVAPSIVAALTLIGFLIGAAYQVAKVRSAQSLGTVQLQEAINRPYGLAAMFLMGIGFVVSILYCVEALQGERRDRSILFWKSLPVSDPHRCPFENDDSSGDCSAGDSRTDHRYTHPHVAFGHYDAADQWREPESALD